ncbi:MAG TPA: hypothetical protein VHN77_03135 [Phycisphaerales bacterium]|nr:hypothetical protein [Phycisphaerales bacterium]
MKLIQQAANCFNGVEMGWLASSQRRYRALVVGIAATARFDESALSSALDDLKSTIQLGGHDAGDDKMQEYLELALTLCKQKDVAKVQRLVNRIAGLLDALPIWHERGSTAVANQLGATLMRHAPAQREWLYSKLSVLREEKVLHRLILEVYQSLGAEYAQVLHGAFENGKDVVVRCVAGGVHELRMFQVKCGNIGAAEWPGVKDQLERMFEAPRTPHASEHSGPVVGVLVLSGHVKPSIFEAVEGWRASRRANLGWRCEVMHMNELVNWILNSGCFEVAQRCLAEHVDATTRRRGVKS